ncbi:MAG: hypothetical protein HYV27_15320 [Candidatus Hydrogenedentes bacterium]|nr:hypothetical protein [Candidatus Hydrogenedentota bacterium]
MASIGGITVWALDGPVQLPGYFTRDEVRDAVDGQDVVLIGIRGEEFPLGITTDASSAANRAALIVSMASLQGFRVDVQDNDGIWWYNLRVKGFRVLAVANSLVAAGGLYGGLYKLKVQFLLKNESTYF